MEKSASESTPEKSQKHLTYLMFLHDQKSDIFFIQQQRNRRKYGKPFNEDHYIFAPGDFEEWREFHDREKVEKTEIEDVVQKINSAILVEKSSHDTEQIALLLEQKKIALQLLGHVFEAVGRYVRTIQALERAHGDAIKHLDSHRRTTHNALMSTMNAAIRFISFHFGSVDEEALDAYVERLEKKGKQMADVVRFAFRKNIICPDTVDLHNRESITYWAINLYEYHAHLFH